LSFSISFSCIERVGLKLGGNCLYIIFLKEKADIYPNDDKRDKDGHRLDEKEFPDNSFTRHDFLNVSLLFSHTKSLRLDNLKLIIDNFILTI